ncbi:hypothetical protein IE53DRAFT_175965 [Violaceomyces palustris]|uniref:Uncharacterized protein n=1 Tax=Violaceomyces palustris TaxID=1673888 RepID=A0ACD0NSQ4_9BASI|nr:hypothetical protein IE53DRAFT_175965 [Violaceomyces palustris]
MAHKPTKYNFTTVTGFFLYDDANGKPETLPAIAPNFGLKEGQTWSKVVENVSRLNRESKDGSLYKLIYSARHGEGYHNLAEAKYGTEAWDDYWSKLYTDGEIVWGPDPNLTAVGIGQAQDAHRAWKEQVKKSKEGSDHAPLPSRLYSSPLTRSADTLRYTWQGILLPESKDQSSSSFTSNGGLLGKLSGIVGELSEDLGRVGGGHHVQPLIKEGFRETYGEHTCDKRSDRSTIHKRFPGYLFEPGFREEDPLWTEERETDQHIVNRVKDALNQVFVQERKAQVISLTSHSGVMKALFQATGHYVVSPKTGALIPFIVKGTPSN